jgi:hypothetical protein
MCTAGYAMGSGGGGGAGLAAWTRCATRFIEPNLEFRLLGIRSPRQRLEVAFSDESLPPWPSRSHLAQVYPQVLDVATDDLAAAADQWARELQPFPRRAPD